MAIDQEQHVIHPHIGFAVDRDTGHIVGLMQAPQPPVAREIEFPKWVVPHESQVTRTGDHIVTPLFPQFHVNRLDGEVTVMVADATEEARALAPKEELAPQDNQPADPADPADAGKGPATDQDAAGSIDVKIAADRAELDRAAQQLAADQAARALANPT